MIHLFKHGIRKRDTAKNAVTKVKLSIHSTYQKKNIDIHIYNICALYKTQYKL